MLQQWGAFNSAGKNQTNILAPAAASESPIPKETSEHRELRLRKQYEQALASHQNNNHREAQKQFSSIAADLRESNRERRAAFFKSAPSTTLPKKRPRSTESPLWERRLRYAVHRNLAEVHFTLQNYLSSLEAYLAALDDDRSDFLIWVRAARAASRCGKLHIARRAYEMALSMRPAHWLCKADYQAVLHAIGDDDEDCKPTRASFSRGMEVQVADMLKNQQRSLQEEKKQIVYNATAQPQLLQLRELSWGHLVDVLRTCLECRLAGNPPDGTLPVAHPVRFEYPSMESLLASHIHSVDSDISDEVQFVSENSGHARPKPADCDMDVVVVSSPEEKGHEKGTRSNVVDDRVQAAGSTNAKPSISGDVDQSSLALAGEEVTIVRDTRQSKGPSEGEKEQPTPQSGNECTEVVTLEEGEGNRKPLLEPCVQLISEADIEKPREVRRSNRQRMQLEPISGEEARRQTRTIAGKKDVIQEDKDLIQGLRAICLSYPEDNEGGSIKGVKPISGARDAVESGELENNVRSAVVKTSISANAAQLSAWVMFVDESTEANAVEERIKSFGKTNSGPADLLLRLLECLSEVKVAQYSSTLALLWSILRERLHLHLPGTATTTALIAEAMLESGKKTGKAKTHRFQEASRLLSHIRLSPSYEAEDALLQVRISWLSSLLHEYRGEMQLAFSSAEQTLSLLEEIEDVSSENLSEVLGPSLSGHTDEELYSLFTRRISSLRMARNLEKAKEELLKSSGDNHGAARQAVSILSPSVHASVRDLELDVWRDADLAIDISTNLEKWESLLNSEDELEPRLTVFGEACAKSSDIVGEFVCFSIRLRMAVHSYAASLYVETKKEEGFESELKPSSGILADLLVQIRGFVAVIRKLSSPSSAHLWNAEAGISGWSMKRAATIASVTLVSVSTLIISKMPSIRLASSDTELSGTQRSRRLGFMRCMLAFARCILVINKCRQRSIPQTIEEDSTGTSRSKTTVTKRMLHVISFCLRALVVRGCCREDGTSGALIKLYIKFLVARLQEMSAQIHGKEGENAHTVGAPNGTTKDTEMASEAPTGSEKDGTVSAENFDISADVDNTSMRKGDAKYQWCDIDVLRDELSQCFHCLYRIEELESNSGSSSLQENRWLKEGCRASKSKSAVDPSTPLPAMDIDVCKNVYFFYRPTIFGGICNRRRDGGRAKKLRELLSRLAEALPQNPPRGVPMLPFQALDDIVGDVLETRDDISKEAAENVSRLEEEWNRCRGEASDDGKRLEDVARNVQFSMLFFEVFVFHAMSTLTAHESEYKKQKNAERRKRPKEAAERLLAACSECIIALRSRPWSIGAWIVLGRIYIEISDLVLDERELNFSSFALYRSEDLAALADGESVETIFGRAQACFGFAESLLSHRWTKQALRYSENLSAAHVLGISCHKNDNEPWCGFGDDGDLFGLFGLTNATTSRPKLRLEPHPIDEGNRKDDRRIAAIRFGEAAIAMLRLREQRYFYLHWNQSAMNCRLPTHPRNRFPDNIIVLGEIALEKLREGQKLFGLHKFDGGIVEVEKGVIHGVESNKLLSPTAMEGKWRTVPTLMERNNWYYIFLEAKLIRKNGGAPQVYLELFHRAVIENKRMRDALKQPADIEPVYKLHSSRIKVLRSIEDNENAGDLLTLLEKYSFKQVPIVVDVAREDGPEAEDWITERKIAIAEDILSAMQACCDPRSEVSFAEYYYKATFCRALILVELLKDTRGALDELNKLFGTEAAAKALDNGPDGIFRGYFYKLWNYRITDTGVEPALESERKFVRWRNKILGLYGLLLKQSGEWRLLAAIIYRLRRRSSEDLPVDGTLLDDLILGYAITSRAAILNSMEKGIAASAAVLESSYRRTWDIYVETLRLSQGIKRVRNSLNRGERSEVGAKRLLQSGRPRCLVAIHTALRLEHMRWKAAQNGQIVARDAGFESLKALPTVGSMESTPEPIRLSFMETVQVSVSKWPLDEKLMRLIVRRVAEFTASEAE